MFFAYFNLIAQEYSIYTQELLKRFPLSDDGFSLDFFREYPNGPTALRFDNNGNLYICNAVENEVLVFNNDLQIIDVISGGASGNTQSFSILDSGQLLVFSRRYLALVNKTGSNIFEFSFTHTSYKNQIDGFPFYLNGVVFAYLDNGGIISINEPERNGLESILNTEETRDLLQEDRFSENGIFLDQDNRVFLDSSIITNSYGIYYSTLVENDNHFIDPSRFNTRYHMFFLGFDNSGNRYWDANGAILIFNHNDTMIDAFICSNYSSKTFPAIHPNGDVFFLDYDNDSITLYRIENTWSPFDWQPSSQYETIIHTAEVTANGLRIRDNPTTSDSTIIDSLNQGTVVEIIGHSEIEETIGNTTSFWYEIRLDSGIEGWVFGAFLEIE